MAVRDPLAKTFVDTALAFHRRAPWTRAPEDEIFLIRVPGVPDPFVADIMGQDGGEPGFGMYCGPGALGWFKDWCAGETTPDSVIYADRLRLTFLPTAEIEEEFRGPLKSAGYRGRKVAPVAVLIPPITDPCPVERDDLRVMAWALRCVLEADELGWLAEIERLQDREETVVEFEISGELDAPEVRFQHVHLTEEAAASETPLLISLPFGLSELPRIDEEWLATLVPLKDRIEGEDDPLHAFVVADAQGLLRCGEVALGEDLRPAGTGLAKALRSGEDARMPPGRPRRIVFRIERLHRALSSALAAIDVEAVLDVGSPAILGLEEDIGDGFGKHLSENPPPPEGPGAEPPTLEEWQGYQDLAAHQLAEDVLAAEIATPRAFGLYFGSVAKGKEIMEQPDSMVPEQAFHEWLAADYRPTSRSRTHLDRMLANVELPFLLRLLLEARRSTEMSIYCVIAVEPGESLEVEDILTGRHHTVHDELLSAPELRGVFLPLRLMWVADWTFATLAGPALPEKLLDSALFFLESTGVTVTHEGLRKARNGIGVLWSWVSEHDEA